MYRRFCTIVSGLLLLALSPSCVTGSEYDEIFIAAGHRYNLSPQLLEAIAAVESSYNPHAFNRNRDGSFDVGIMQINSWWYSYLGHQRWMKLGDPVINIDAGAEILSLCVQRFGYTWEAVGCYHSPHRHQQKAYIAKIVRELTND